jgi:hypothetical protein
MKLQDILDEVEQLSDDKTILARKPWTLESDAEVVSLDAEFRIPEAERQLGFDYFLEISVAIEVLEVFGDRKPTLDERRALLMYYAENDAYPDWVFQSRTE